MTERATARRIYVPDVRGTDSYLRMTWHADQRIVVVSQWDGPVCTAATRVAVTEAPELISFLAGALADAATPLQDARPEPPSRPAPWWRRWTDRFRPPRADVIALPEAEHPLRWRQDVSG